MRVFARIAVVVLLVAIVGGIGFGIYDAGYDQGVVDTADSTTEIVVTERYRDGFFPFGAVFGFFFLFLLFGMMFKFAFGWRRWAGHDKCGGRDGYRSHMNDRMSRWHDEAHGRKPRDDTSSEPASPVS